MSEASFASLGPTLLARKGGAKPAMRPQLAPLPETVEPEQLEDLGWNDMGGEDEASEGGNIVSISPSATPSPANEDTPLVAEPVEAPLVKAKPAAKTARPAKAKARKKAPKKAPAKSTSSAAKRAAFTLRLDSDRHLKLRLASTMQGVSAQALVTEALDALFDEIEDLDTLAQTMGGRMKRH